MNLRRLVLRSAAYHWRTNLAVALGVAVAVSVLAGALLVGARAAETTDARGRFDDESR